MPIPKFLAVAAIVSAALTAPALAQEVIYEPGYCAFFYPNANCNNIGANNPQTGDYQRRLAARGQAEAGVTEPRLRKRRAHRSR